MEFLKDRVLVARCIFGFSAVLWAGSIAVAGLFTAIFFLPSLPIFFLLAVLCASFCYGAYKGLTSPNVFFQILFWIYVAINLFGFPVGTGIAVASVWLRSELQNSKPKAIQP